MNANVKGMLLYYRHKKINNIIIDSDGRYMSDEEARKFLSWCVQKGYETFNDVPESEGKDKPWL